MASALEGVRGTNRGDLWTRHVRVGDADAFDTYLVLGTRVDSQGIILLNVRKTYAVAEGSSRELWIMHPDYCDQDDANCRYELSSK